MATVYQHDANGFYVGQSEDFGGPMPHNCVVAAPTIINGFVPHWTGEVWEQVESHLDEKGYVDGQPFTVVDYGPYPEGWSTEPPPPTKDQKLAVIKANIRALEQKGERPNREINLALVDGQTPPADAVTTLKEVDAAIVELRAEMAALDA